jgi:hypothetical protein
MSSRLSTTTEEERSMDIPRLTCAYPMRKSPDYEKLEKDRFHEWILSYAPFADERRRKKARATDYPYLTAVCWPACDARRLWDVSALVTVFNERDDEYDAERYGASLDKLRQSAVDVRAHYASVTEPRWGHLLADIWGSFAKYVPAPQMARFSQVVGSFLDGCIAYDEWLIEKGAFTRVEDYLEARYQPLGQLIDHVLVELSLGIDIGEVLEEPALAAVVRADVERVAVIQDILSLRKDLALGEDAENVVLVIARSRACPVSLALAEACGLYEEKMARFDALAEELTATSLGRERDVGLFVEGLRNFVAGLIEWTLHSARYTLKDKSGWHTQPAVSASLAQP